MLLLPGMLLAFREQEISTEELFALETDIIIPAAVQSVIT